MKKITLKITTFLCLVLFAFQGHGQAVEPDANGWGLYGTRGTYKVKLKDQVGGVDLLLTVRASDLKLEYAQELADSDPLAGTQLWIFDGHPNPTGSGYLIMTSAIPDIGFIKIDEATTGTPTPIVGTTRDDLGQIQMRKIANSEPDYDSNASMPGQNQIFLRGAYTGTEWEGQTAALRFSATPVEGEIITLGTSGRNFRFKFIEPLLGLSNEEFDTSSIFISNPVQNELSIKGLPSNVKQVLVYSLLGQEILTKKVDAQPSLTIDVSTLKSGMYLVEMKGDIGAFTKKIVKN